MSVSMTKTENNEGTLYCSYEACKIRVKDLFPVCVEKNISNQVKCYSRVVRVNSEESVAVRDAANNCHSYFGFYKWCK